MFLLILGIFGGKSFQGSLMGWAFIVSLVAVVIALLADVFDPYGGGFFGWYEQIHPGTRSTLWILLIVVVFVMFLMKDDSADKKGFLGKIAEDIKKIEED